MKMVTEVLEEVVGEGMYFMENQSVYCTDNCKVYCLRYMDMYFDSLLNFLQQC